MVFEARGTMVRGGRGFVGEGVWVARRRRYMENMHLERGQRLCLVFWLCSGNGAIIDGRVG